MNIPGFTASTSLYRAGGRYRASANRSGASANVGAVLPQLQRERALLLCLEDCDNNPSCVAVCNATHGGETGETSTFCPPGCGRCIPDPESRTGRSKTCNTADCRLYQKRC
jgi:hypothetical protein